MIKRFLILFFVTIEIFAMAQHGDNWAFGLKSGITFLKSGVIQKIPTSIEFDSTSGLDANGNRAAAGRSLSFSDCNGKLVLYGSELQLWNQFNYTIDSGLLKLGNETNAFSKLILPLPNNPNIIYYFLSSNYYSNRIENGFYYFLIDIGYNNGQGKVVKKVKLNDHTSNQLNFAQHSNNKDIWILNGYDDKTLYSYLLTDTGLVTTPIVSNNIFMAQYDYPYRNQFPYLPQSPYRVGPMFSNIAVSNNKKTIISTSVDTCTTQLGCTWQYDFDNTTGKAGNGKPIIRFNEIPVFTLLGTYAYSCFSTNDTFCYFITRGENIYIPNRPQASNRIYQYNLNTGKKTIIYSERKYFSDMQLGPDGKIYFIDLSQSLTTLYRIKYPNKNGIDCNIEKILSDSSFLGTHNLPTVYAPYRPLYFYSNLEKSPCQDTATFELHVDTNFRSLTVFYGDGDSVHFNKPLQSVYHLKHKYLQNGKYFVQLKALTPQCDYFSYAGDSFAVATIPKRFGLSKSNTPFCNSSQVFIKDSFVNATQVIYQWQNGNDTAIINSFTALVQRDRTFENKSSSQVYLTIKTSNQECPNYEVKIDSIALYFLPHPTFSFAISGHQNQDSFNHKPRYLGCEPLLIKAKDSSNQNKVSHLFWDNQSQVLNQQTNIQKTFTQGSYTAIVNDTNALGCVNADTFYIKAWQKPQVSLSINNAQQCIKDNAFEIKNTSQSSIDSVWYELHINNTTHSLKADSVFKITFTQAGNYTISIKAFTEKGCNNQFDTMIEVYPANTNRLQILKTDTCLNSNQIQINITGNTATTRQQILWGDGQTTDFPSNSHRYAQANAYKISLISTTSNNCKDTQSQSIVIYENPQFTFNLQDSIICENQLASINLSNQGPSLTYNIDWGDGPLETNLQQGNYKHQYSQNGPFVVAAEGRNMRCKTTLKRNILILPIPEVQIIAQGFCQNEPTIISATNNAVYQYFWNNNTQSNQSPSYETVYKQTGDYKITLKTKDNNNCQTTDSFNLQIVAKPKAAFSFANQSQTQQYQFQFINESKSANGYKWHFIHQAQKDSSFEKSPKIVFSDTGFYQTILIANNNNLCFDTAIQTVPIFDKLEFYFPTVFSPNGNGTNDAFGLNTKQIPLVKEYKLEIFNRWGERLFSSTDPRKEWQAANVPIGVYVYQSTIRDVFNILHELKGVVEVLR